MMVQRSLDQLGSNEMEDEYLIFVIFAFLGALSTKYPNKSNPLLKIMLPKLKLIIKKIIKEGVQNFELKGLHFLIF